MTTADGRTRFNFQIVCTDHGRHREKILKNIMVWTTDSTGARTIQDVYVHLGNQKIPRPRSTPGRSVKESDKHPWRFDCKSCGGERRLEGRRPLDVQINNANMFQLASDVKIIAGMIAEGAAPVRIPGLGMAGVFLTAGRCVVDLRPANGAHLR